MGPSREALARLTKNVHAWLAFLDSDADDSDTTVFQAYLDVLREFLEGIADAVVPRDQWRPFWSGSSVILRSAKLEHDFTFEVDDLGARWLLSSTLGRSQHLPKMADQFWRTLLELHDYGSPSFVSNRLMTEHKSILWTIMAEHSLLASDEECDTGTDQFLDSGTLELSWPLGTPAEQLKDQLTESFRRLYRLNYLLYRHDYILTASRAKHHARKCQPHLKSRCVQSHSE
jgi:hypothetical protein